MNPYEAYVKFLAVKKHFTDESYDYHKFHGKLPVKVETFEKHRNKWKFVKLAKNHKDDLVPFLVANFVNRRIGWVGDLSDDPQAEETYLQWRKTHESLTYTFRGDLQKIRDYLDEKDLTPESLFDIVGSLPRIVTLYTADKITLESLVIFVKSMGCLSYLDKITDDEYLWPELRLRITKYQGFFEIDTKTSRKNIKRILLT